jgi:hypothetical protein
MSWTRAGCVGAAVLSTVVLSACTRSATSTAATQATEVAVTISGGRETDLRDGGRPVVLIAAALGVPADVFRTAFTGVTPAAAGAEPEGGQVDRNKSALLAVLSPYGVTNARLDQVSNHYRYNGAGGGTWPIRQAAAVATIRSGKVLSIVVTDPGVGYTSTPTIAITGTAGAAVAELSFGADLTTNGSVAAIRLPS